MRTLTDGSSLLAQRGRQIGIALSLLLLLASAGCRGAAQTARAPIPPSATPTGATSSSPSPPVRSVSMPSLRPLEAGNATVPAPPTLSAPQAAPPIRIRIPTIGVDSSLARLDRNPDGTVQVPSDPGQAGWFQRGAAPGADGPAVILGHFDSAAGPGIFYKLAQLRPGDPIRIQRADGSEVFFAVQRSATYSLDAFPSFEVYGATARPELRLITCGGAYSASRTQYLANTIVFASLSG
jgi:hypothetical protein